MDSELRKAAGKDPAPASKNIWLDAWIDPVAGLSAHTPCVHTCNLLGDGDWRLVVADTDKKLKVWRATQKQSDYTLLDNAVAITSFISDITQPRLPFLAVASGSHVYIYRNLRPFYKFVLPPDPVDPQEQDIWTQLSAAAITADAAEASLAGLQEAGTALTARSLDLLALPDGAAKKAYIQQCQGQPLAQATVITSMISLRQSLDEVDAVSCIVAGTENKHIMILNSSGTAVAKTIWLGAVPAFLAGSGLLDVSYVLAVASRDSKIYIIRNGELTSSVIQLDSQPVGLALVNKSLVVGCMNETMHSFRLKGQKNFSVYLPSPILTMQLLSVQGHRQVRCVLLALANGEVRLYNEKHLVSVHTVPSPVTAVHFGRYGREDNTLITVLKNGTLDIKILPRAANLDVSSAAAGPPPEQDIPLQIPKKTRLYVEQTQREREQAVDMHCIFQRDLCKLRLSTARAYVKVLTDGQGASSFTSSANLAVNAGVQGLGPRFKVSLLLKNDGQKPITNLVVKLMYNDALYEADKRSVMVPLLVPSLQYVTEVDILCKDPSASPDAIRIVLVNANSNIPYLTALLKMPLSEMDEE